MEMKREESEPGNKERVPSSVKTRVGMAIMKTRVGIAIYQSIGRYQALFKGKFLFYKGDTLQFTKKQFSICV